jgi:hypothetical protein
MVDVLNDNILDNSVNILTKGSAYTLTAADARANTTVVATAAMLLTLPTAVSGYKVTLLAGQGVTAIIQVQPASADYIVVAGVRKTAATALKSGGAAGDRITLTAVSTTDWIASEVVGTWAE